MQGKQPSQEALLAFVVQVHSLKNLIHVSLTKQGEIVFEEELLSLMSLVSH